MITEKHELEIFLKEELPSQLERVTPDLVPLWGKMNVQQMMEHLSFTFLMATQKLNVRCTSDPSKIPLLKRFVMSTKVLPRLFKNPLLPDNPIPVTTSSLAEARKAVLQSVHHFFAFFEEKPLAVTTHNVFGDLNYHEWLVAHYKHILHHLTQFGIGLDRENRAQAS